MFVAGAARGALGFHDAAVLEKVGDAGAHAAPFFDGERLDRAGRADLRAMRAVIGTERDGEVLIGLEKTGESVRGDRGSQNLVRAVRDAEVAGGAAALEMGERCRAGREHGAFVRLGESAIGWGWIVAGEHDGGHGERGLDEAAALHGWQGLWREICAAALQRDSTAFA